jgi:hypothetical protein
MTKLYSWTAWLDDGDNIKIAGITEEGFRIPAQTYETAQWLLLPENAHPERPGYTSELCKLLSKK